jgi:hypothetical protein
LIENIIFTVIKFYDVYVWKLNLKSHDVMFVREIMIFEGGVVYLITDRFFYINFMVLLGEH